MKLEDIKGEERCELCGAIRDITGGDYPESALKEFCRYILSVADDTPYLALIILFALAGKSVREISSKLNIDHSTVVRKLKLIKKPKKG